MLYTTVLFGHLYIVFINPVRFEYKSSFAASVSIISQFSTKSAKKGNFCDLIFRKEFYEPFPDGSELSTL